MILEVAVIFILSQLILGLYLWYNVKDLYQYPNNFGFPVIGTLYYFYEGLMFRSLNTAYNYCVKRAGNGVLFTYLQGKKVLVLSCPYIIEEIAQNPNASQKAISVYSSVNKLIKGSFTYCPIDSEYKLRRKEMNNSIARPLIDGPYNEIFIKRAKELAEEFQANKDSIDLEYHCNNTTIKVVKGTHFGIKDPLSAGHKFFKLWITTIMATSVMYSNILARGLFQLTYKILDIILFRMSDTLQSEIAGNQKKLLKIAQDSTTVSKYLPLSTVIAMRNRNRNLHKSETSKELYELIIAGSHTVSTAMIGAFAFIATLPDIQEKLWKEQYELFGTSDRDPTLDDLRKMTYLDRFIKELLRFFTPSFLAKDATAEVKVAGITIPAGTVIYFLLGKIRMDPKYWEDPHVFNPDRDFENKPKYANPNFGVGIRNCPGAYYTKQELKNIISIIIRKFKLSSTQKYEDFKYETHLMYELVNVKPIQVEPRIY